MREGFGTTADSHSDTEDYTKGIYGASVNEVSTYGRATESVGGVEVGLEQFSGFPGQLISYPPGNCLQKDDEEPLDLRFRTVKQCVKSQVERKESLLDKVAEEEAELEFVVEGLGLSRKKRVDSRFKKVQKAQLTRSMVGADKEKKPTTGGEGRTDLAKTPGIDSSVQPDPLKRRKRVEPSWELEEKITEGQPAAVDDLKKFELIVEIDFMLQVARFVKGIWLGIEEEKSELKMGKIELEKKLARAGIDALKEAKQLDILKVSHAVAIGQLQVEARANLDEMVVERDKLGCHLMLKGYFEEEVDTIKVDTYVKEGEDEDVEVVGVMDGLDGVSYQTVLGNQGDDTELQEGDNDKALREMSLKIKDVETGLAREKEIFASFLSAQVELQVTQAISDLNHKVEEKDVKKGKGLKELAERTKNFAKLQSRISALMVKSKPDAMAQCRIYVLERSEGQF
ncbi:hypothetical protein GIB67_003331 [Kingdonia uniflora]|uniref:Uncharacterized protein n=1 Tax=Kingdonia uniflora TaxID=39325 RepID=A0A7J7P929_9MAGN|nr:hypothetical protein GIB67_003331 [Kingdonia uniflora]